MLLIKACHIIAVIAWFAGLFYLPRLFVYHADACDAISLERFKVMERRLYYAIMWPSAILTTVFGVWLMTFIPSYYLTATWMHGKLLLVGVLWGYHLLCGRFVKQFARDNNTRSARLYRFFNEVPTLLLVGIVMLVVMKP
jgi:protoporphyrinogen IX oxidase